MISEQEELEKTLKLMHMLASIFAPEKYVAEQNATVPVEPIAAPKESPKPARFTALKAKLEAHNKEQAAPPEASDGLSEG